VTGKLMKGVENVQPAVPCANLQVQTNGTEYTHTHAWVYKIHTQKLIKYLHVYLWTIYVCLYSFAKNRYFSVIGVKRQNMSHKKPYF
jgi:hypothetical protein